MGAAMGAAAGGFDVADEAEVAVTGVEAGVGVERGEVVAVGKEVLLSREEGECAAALGCWLTLVRVCRRVWRRGRGRFRIRRR